MCHAKCGQSVYSGKLLESTEMIKLAMPHCIPVSSNLIEEVSESVLCNFCFCALENCHFEKFISNPILLKKPT